MRFLFLCALLGLMAAPVFGVDALKPYKVLAKSKPVTIHGLEFVAVTEAQWVVFKTWLGRDPVEAQLWIANRTTADRIFSVFDTFRLKIADASGKELRVDGGRDATLQTRPVLIRAGETYCLSRPASLKWNADGKTRTFSYDDETGGWYVIDSMAAGAYTLSFSLESKGLTGDMQWLDRMEGISWQGHPPVWAGEGSTLSVPFRVVDLPTGP